MDSHVTEEIYHGHKKIHALTVVFMVILALLSACASLQTQPTADANTSQSQTGLPELDVIIAAALEGDAAKLRSLLEFTQTTCTFAEGLGGPPKCLRNEQEGAPVEVLPFLGPEGHFIRKEDIDTWAGLDVSALFAVYQVSETAFSDENYPAGEYALVFIDRPEMQTSTTLQVRQGRIVRIDSGFVYPPEIREDDVVRYLVPPNLISP